MDCFTPAGFAMTKKLRQPCCTAAGNLPELRQPCCTAAGNLPELRQPCCCTAGDLPELRQPCCSAAGDLPELRQPCCTAAGHLRNSAQPYCSAAGNLPELRQPCCSTAGDLPHHRHCEGEARSNPCCVSLDWLSRARRRLGCFGYRLAKMTKIGTTNFEYLHNKNLSVILGVTLRILMGALCSAPRSYHSRLPLCRDG
jgi:hypothetical protein